MLGRAVAQSLEALSRMEVYAVPHDRLDVTDTRSVGESFERSNPDAIIHTAAFTDVDGCEIDEPKAKLVNVTGTQNVAQAAARRGSRLIVISTDYVFSGDHREPLTEDDAPGPRSAYGRTKLGAEGAAILHYDRPVIIRTAGLYGAKGRHFPGAIARRIQRDEPIRVVDDQYVSPSYVRDVAGAVVRILTMPHIHGLYHVANTGVVTWFEFATQVAALMGKPDYPIEPISSNLLDRPAPRPAYSALDSTKLSMEVGVLMRPVAEALRAFVKDQDGKIA